MKITWLGHAAFLITSDSGTRIITDPYHTADDIKYGRIEETADIVIVSHEQHTDHSNIAAVLGRSFLFFIHRLFLKSSPMILL